MRSFRTSLVVAGALCLVAAMAGYAWGGDNPPGNNGTVKVDGFPFDGGQSNDPHVDCGFQIDFFGFDQGDLTGSVTFELTPPTGNVVLFEGSTSIGEDPAGGGTDLDGSLFEDLSGPIAASGESPQLNQGFHVALTVQAQGSIGSMTKHKTFWVDNCGGDGGGGEEG
jgi:hypothetical protein